MREESNMSNTLPSVVTIIQANNSIENTYSQQENPTEKFSNSDQKKAQRPNQFRCHFLIRRLQIRFSIVHCSFRKQNQVELKTHNAVPFISFPFLC